MSSKDLKDKAINIKGKKYVLVADRVLYFNETYDKGSIHTELVSPYNSDLIVMKATIYPMASDELRYFTGYSQAIIGDGTVNKTAALENAETSAVGRALAMMGIGVIESIASVDEINKAQGSTGQRQIRYASEKQIKWLRDTAREINDQLGEDGEVDAWIESILTVTPQRVPLFKVKDAVDKLKEKPKPEDTVVDLTEEEINRGIDDLPNLPY